MNRSPIILFVYNRPQHTRKTLDALKANEDIHLHPLIIFSDAPKSEKDKEDVQAVRDIIRNITGFASLEIIERQKNLGLASSIETGVSEIIDIFGACIVLEDDIVTSPYFLSYMNTALTLYEQEKQVMHINGYCPPLQLHSKQETFFYRIPQSWGWATWKDRWQLYISHPKKLLEMLKEEKLSYFDIDGHFKFSSTLRANIRGDIHTWAIKWYASIVLNDGLCLYPTTSVAYNIGHDSSGEHSQTTTVFDVPLSQKKIDMHTIKICEDTLVKQEMISFYTQIKPTFFEKIRERLRRYL